MFSIGRTGHFIGTALVPIVAYVCFREYTGTETSASRLAVLLIMPAISISLAATNVYHELMWYGPFTNAAGEYLTHPVKWGPWFLFAHLPFSYLVIGAAMMTLLAHSSAVAPAHRRGLFLLTAACIGPLAATAAYDLGVGPDTLSYVPLVFVAFLPIYAWLIVGEQIIEFSPLAYETVFQNMQDPVVVIDDQCRIIGSEPHGREHAVCQMRRRHCERRSKTCSAMKLRKYSRRSNSGEPQKMMTATGRFLHVQVLRSSPIGHRLAGGQVLMFRDVSDVEKAQSEVRKNEKLLRTLIDHSVNGIVRFSWVDGEDGQRALRSIFANSAAGKFLGSDVDDLVDCSATQVIRHAVSGMDDDVVDDVMHRFASSAESGKSLDVEVRQRENGTARWLRVICEPVGEDIAATFVDITDSKAKERQMESIATSDPLTGVLNRRGFERDAAQRLTQSEDDATGALLFIDLNDFKGINDQFGHEVGDQLLKVAAERLKKSLRSCDIIGRPGGDEFVALVPDVDAADSRTSWRNA